MKHFLILLLSVLLVDVTHAKKHKRTWDYPLHWYKKFEVTGSEDFFEFTSDLRKDMDVIKEIKNNKETGVLVNDVTHWKPYEENDKRPSKPNN